METKVKEVFSKPAVKRWLKSGKAVMAEGGKIHVTIGDKKFEAVKENNKFRLVPLA
jgi:hypothetical protein